MKFNMLIMVVALALAACTTKDKEVQEAETVTNESDPNEWPEMDSFHMIMAEAFHPYKDSTNLEPVKRLSEEMAMEADKWASSTLPAKVNNDAVKAQLNQLKTDTRALADKIKGGASDAEIGSSLKSLHDSFHGIMEAWNGSEENHEHEH